MYFTWNHKHKDFSVTAMGNKTSIRLTFLWKTIKGWLENLKKKKKQTKLKDVGVARTFSIIAHLLHQICQILPRVFANGKKKGKERKCHASQQSKVLLKVRFPKEQLKGRCLALFLLNTGKRSQRATNRTL